VTYRINEIFYSVQGEGHWTGRPAVFVRFSGCNLWNGVEADRATSICTFCDTDFVAVNHYTLKKLVTEMTLHWPGGGGTPMVVFTGGEPLLQLDDPIVDTLRDQGWYVAVETNGTTPISVDVDWVCVSPKTPTVRITEGHELKLVYPQKIQPEQFRNLNFHHFWLSPMDGPNLTANTEAAFNYCLDNPQWRLNIQTHKVIGQR
jgi:7-carboxy-7-deazaguanine synthase (Cx14CxxC type)